MPPTWRDELIRGLKFFGGEAHRRELFDYIRETTSKKITINIDKTLQKDLERFSSDSNNFGQGEDIFYSVTGIGNGIWGLNQYKLDDNIDFTQDDIQFPEGKKLFKIHISRERNAQIVRIAKQFFIKKHGKLYCEVCKINFMDKYGEIGKDFIEAHHNKIPISNMDDNHTTKIEDLVMLCSNCHSMVHRLESNNIEDLKKIFKNTNKQRQTGTA